MKDKINRLSRGIFENEIPELTYPKEISEQLASRGTSRGEFLLGSSNNIDIKGLCYSDNIRVKAETKTYIGTRSRIFYSVDASFFEGEEIKGNFYLVTNAGEVKIPYSFKLCRRQTDEALRELKTVHSMKKLYDRDPEKLLLLFECGDFVKAPFMDDARLRNLYDGLSGRGDRMHAMQQFMMAAGVLDNPDRNKYRNAKSGEELTDSQKFLLNNIPDDLELLCEVCSMLIKGQVTELFAFYMYEQAIKRDISITRLYEYYLYSFPEDYVGRMPKEALMYFSYDTGIDRRIKSVIYKNILMYVRPESEIYRRYEDEMRDYALESIFKNRIDDRLAVIYDKMIYREMIDKKVAAVFPSILKTCLIKCPDPHMRQVVVRYDELVEEEVYQLWHGRAYVPVYFEDAAILFTDVYGNRYADVSYTRLPVLAKPELLRRCFDVYPEHPMLKISAARKTVSEGIKDANGKAILEDVMKNFELNPVFRKRLVSALLKYQGNTGFLGCIDTDELSKEEKSAAVSALVHDRKYREAYRMIKRYGFSAARPDDLRDIVKNLVTMKNIPEEEREFFLSLCYEAFNAGSRKPELLDFLCREYEGPEENMYYILTEAVRHDAYTHGISEKLLVTKLFSGDTDHIDEIFKYYLEEGDAEENIIKAYLTTRSYEYFVCEKEADENVFEYLESAIREFNDYEKAPTVYLLALTKHYSELKELTEERKKLCEELTDILISENYIFYYTKKLSKLINIPAEIKNKYYIEYHGEKHNKPSLYVRIKPGDTDFREEEMRRVYQGIYVKDMVLFSDDELNYMIYDSAVSDEPVEKGMISGKQGKGEDNKSRIAKLDEITALLKETDKAGELKKRMLDYALKNAVNEELFKIKDYGFGEESRID